MSGRLAAGALALGLPVLALTACPRSEATAGAPSATEPSPNASILPQPLASGADPGRRDAGRGGLPADSAGRLILPEASTPPPELMREDVALPRDTLTPRDSNGVTLEARFVWADVPAPAAVPEARADVIQKARDKTALDVTIDLGQAGRMRFALTSIAFPLAKNTELRAATHRYGHVLVWPDSNAYRIVLPGAARALLAERRADVTPIAPARAKRVGTGSFLGLPTDKMELKGALGTVVLEQASEPLAGPSGALLCRLLVELVGADPSSTVCAPESTPLKAEYRWTGKGRLAFEVTSLTRRADLPIGQLFVPPAGAEFKAGELPPQPSGVLFSQSDLAAFRTRPAAGEEPSPQAPGEGITAVNRSDLLRYVLLDGVPIAWVRPKSEQYVIGPLAGRYVVSWRDFLGTELEPPKTLALPAKVTLGNVAVAGAPAP
jgi:hypothetical protein